MEAPARAIPIQLASDERADHLAALFHGLRDAVVFARFPEGVILDANDAFVRLFAAGREDVLGHSVETLFPSREAWTDFQRALAPAVAEGRELRAEVVLRRRDGTSFPAEFTLSPVRRAEGRVASCVGILRALERTTTAGANGSEEPTSQQARLIESLHEAAGRIAAELDLERAVQAATDAATSLTGAAFGAFFYNVVGADGGSYALYTLSGVPRAAFEKFPMPRNTAVFAPTFDGEGTIRSDDITKDPRYGRNAPHRGMPAGHLPVRSYLAVPVKSRDGRVLGGIFLGHAEPSRFNATHERLAEGIATHAAAALDNAHLYRAARLAGERLRSVFEHAPVQILTVDPDGTITSVNRTAEPGAETRVVGTSVYDKVPPADRDRVLPMLRAAVETGAPAEYELRAEVFGEPLWLQVKIASIRDEGRHAGAVILATDVTARKRATEALRESEARFRALITATTQMVWSTDAQGKIVDMPEWRAFTGQSVTEVSGDGWTDAIHPEDRQRVFASWTRAYDARATYECEYRVRHHSGGYRWFLARAVPRSDAGGALIEYIGTWTDVTAQRQALQEAESLRMQLAQSEKLSALGSLVGGVAHEIRTPLTYLSNNLSIVEMSLLRAYAELPAERAGALKAKLDERMRDAHESVERIERLVADLRKFTKRKTGHGRSAASLDSLAREAIDIFRATHRGMTPVRDELLPTSLVLADRVQLQQVILNLLQNAIEARPHGNLVRVATRDAPEGPTIEVEDEAGGIGPDVLLRMWDPFYTTKPEGTGLGLSIVKRILEEHGARVDVHSEPGKGTRFTIVFPRLT
ncbi:MAG TPA: PAS domain S-box protein [Candidatus Thermoplasmatota archaeon]|nr:PAS domain S-box protein [Candidatus Thermoplasmatota archaeon]